MEVAPTTSSRGDYLHHALVATPQAGVVAAERNRPAQLPGDYVRRWKKSDWWLKASGEGRIEVLIRVEAGLLSVSEAAGLLGVGERQARRLLTAYRRDGPRVVVHGNRGRKPAHTVPEVLRERVWNLSTGR